MNRTIIFHYNYTKFEENNKQIQIYLEHILSKLSIHALRVSSIAESRCWLLNQYASHEKQVDVNHKPLEEPLGKLSCPPLLPPFRWTLSSGRFNGTKREKERENASGERDRQHTCSARVESPFLPPMVPPNPRQGERKKERRNGVGGSRRPLGKSYSPPRLASRLAPLFLPLP